MSLDDRKEIFEWRKRAFECKSKDIYDIEIQNGMTRIHDNEVNIISENNLLHDIINPPKCIKTLNRDYSPILHGCMNTRKGGEKCKPFKSYWIVGVVPQLYWEG